MVITTAQLHLTKPELRFCAGSNPARGVSEIRDDEDLWQWSRLEIRLNAFSWSTIPQKQFIIIILSSSSSSSPSSSSSITIKAMTIFILFQMSFWYRNGSPVGKMHRCCLQLRIYSNCGRNYCKYNDLIKYRDGSTTPAIFGMNVFVTIVYGYQPLVIVTKISILDVSRVLDLPLKCNDLTN